MVARHNGKLVKWGNPTTTLEDLFVRIIAESEAHPGRRVLRESPQEALVLSPTPEEKNWPMSTEDLETRPFGQWLSDSLGGYGWRILAVFLLVAAICWLVAAVRSNPWNALNRVGRALLQAVEDLLLMRPRRVAALTWLAIKESIRRRVIVVFIVFLVIILFAGWFLHPESDNPVRLYLSFLLSCTGYLMLLLAVFLSALSLPKDIKDHTIYTIVTKPVRASEVVLGRILGFTVVSTVLLVGMACASYVFLQRGLYHTHQIVAADLQPEGRGGAVAGKGSVGRVGFTTKVQGHAHAVHVNPEGFVYVAPRRDIGTRCRRARGCWTRPTRNPWRPARRRANSWPAFPFTARSAS